MGEPVRLLLLGTARLCKCSVRRRARLSRLLTGRTVHNMSPTQPASQPASREDDREQRGDEREEAGHWQPHSQSKLHPLLSVGTCLDTHLNEFYTRV